MQLMFLAVWVAQACFPADVQTGYFSHYGQSPTDGTIDYHQRESGKLPKDMSQYIGVIAVKDCKLVGRDAWLKFQDERVNPDYIGIWLPVKIFDCSGHVETTEWMNENNIVGELGYYISNAMGVYKQGQIEGEMILTAPADIEWICEEGAEQTPIPVMVPPPTPEGTKTIPQVLTAQAPTATPTTAPTAAIVWRKITSSAQALPYGPPTKTPEPSTITKPIVESKMGASTVFDAIDNLPLIFAGFFVVNWTCFGVIMYLLGRLANLRRSAEKLEQALDMVLSLLQAERSDIDIDT